MEFYNVKKEEDDNYYCNGKILSGEMLTLSDPTYDLTFKYLFSSQNVEEISGEDRLTSLLNSLIYQNKIQSIQELNTEYIKYNYDVNKNLEPLRALRSDLAFKITLKDKKDCNLIELINIEMQLGFPGNFLERLINYGLLLKERNKDKNNHNYKTLVLGFINYKGKIELKSNSYFLSEFNSEDNKFIKKVDDFVDIVLINLFEISKKLENNEKIYILGEEVGNIGKNWLKLLSLRHWAKKLKNNTFLIPNINSNKEINSAIKYLKGVQDNDLMKYYQAENDYYNEIKEAAKSLAKEETEKAKKEAEKVREEMEKKIENAKKEEAEKVKGEMEKKIENAKKEAEKAKKEAEKVKEENLKNFLNSYKNYNNYSLEDYEKITNINFSELDMKKVIAYWGKEEKYENKLNNLKEYIGKKRKKNSNINPK